MKGYDNNNTLLYSFFCDFFLSLDCVDIDPIASYFQAHPSSAVFVQELK